MKKLAMLTIAGIVAIAATAAATDGFKQTIMAFLTGDEEVPVVLTTGRGTLVATTHR